MYILVNKQTNRIDAIYKNYKPSNVDENKQYLCEVEGLPIRTSNQYLVAENIKTTTRVIREAYDEIIQDIDETGKLFEKKVHHYTEYEDYLTCDLRRVDMPPRVLSEEEKHEKYKAEVKRLIRLRYSPDDVEAMLCNNSKASIKEEHKIEFEIFQAYRDECKAKAHKEVYEN